MLIFRKLIIVQLKKKKEKLNIANEYLTRYVRQNIKFLVKKKIFFYNKYVNELFKKLSTNIVYNFSRLLI